MKKFLCLFLSLAMLFIFASCGDGNQKEEPSADEDISVSQEAEGETSASAEVQNKGGLLSSFTAETLDGKEVDQSIFEGKITMVNIWATFCSPCIKEMPDLQKLHEDYSDKGFQVIGIVCDIYENNGVFDEGSLTEAREIVKDTGVKYISLLPSDDLKEAKLNDVTYVPETFFVDENGNVIGESFIGSRSYEDWADIIDDVLENQ